MIVNSTMLANQKGLLFLVKGLDPGTALSFAIVLHACYYFPLVVAGDIVSWREGYSLSNLRREASENREPKARKDSGKGLEE